MWNILLHLLLAILVLLGLTEAFRLLLFWLLKTKQSGRLFWAIRMQGHDEEAEITLRSAAERFKWVPVSEEKIVLCVDCGMDEETRKICEMTASQLPVIIICSPEELEEIMEQ